MRTFLPILGCIKVSIPIFVMISARVQKHEALSQPSFQRFVGYSCGLWQNICYYVYR
jgi:hypothetical protein